MSLSLTISRRFALLAVLSGIIAVGAVAFSLTRARDAMIAQKRSEIRFLVESAVTMIEGQRQTPAAADQPEMVKARLAEMLRPNNYMSLSKVVAAFAVLSSLAALLGPHDSQESFSTYWSTNEKHVAQV